MLDGSTNSLVSLGDISKPADTLIRKVSNAVGGLFAPYQIRRCAKAEAEAAILRAETEIHITDLHRRAIHRFIEEQAHRQQNIEDITLKALRQLTESSDPASVEDDWITNFFDKSRIVSDSEMQDLWGRVLAGEANSPGSYSKRTVNFLCDLEKADAESFSKLCGFVWDIGSPTPLIFDIQASVYTDQGINFNAVSHLESIGLVQFKSFLGFSSVELPKHIVVAYFGQPLRLEMPKDTGNSLELGDVLLTQVGQELAPISGSKPVHGFMDYIKIKWEKYLSKSET